MFLRSFYGLVLSAMVLLPLQGQDVVIYSKKSDEIAKQLKELVEKLDDKVIKKAYGTSSITPLTEVSTEYTGKSFEADESLTAKSNEAVEAVLKEFNEEAGKLTNKNVAAEVPILKAKAIKTIKETLDKLKAGGLAPLKEAIQKLNAELAKNEESFNKLNAAEIADLNAMIADILKELKELNEEAVTKSKGEPVTDIKKAAEEMTNKEAEEKYPFPNKKEKEAEAVKKFPKFKVGDKVKFVYYPTPTRPRNASGSIRSMTKDKIKVNFDTINIDDIKDPIIRDGMRSDVTDKNRKKYVDDIFTDIRKARSKYYNTNLQPNADKIIEENFQKGFILASGKWQPAADYVSTLLSSKLKDWKEAKLKVLEDAKLADGQLINNVEMEIAGYNKPSELALNVFNQKIDKDADQAIKMKSVVVEGDEFTDDDLKKFEEQQKKEAEAKAAAAAEAAAKKKADAKAAKAKADLAAKLEEEPESAGSGSMVMIGIVLLVIGAVAFAFFNPKIRSKLIPGSAKKKSMEDVVANLAPPPGTELPMPGGPTPPGAPGGSVAPPPGVPAGMAPPAAAETGSIEKTKIDLDGDVSIVRGEDANEAPQAAPRKKISLNLGSSTPSLAESAPADGGAASTQNSIDPASIGGLTPPGGGLKPPGSGGLTPPGGGLTPPGGGLKPPGSGGLTPPGGGLTPPGGGLKPPGGDSQASGSDDSGDDSGTEDKSNLILNPNLDGSGSKLRLKK